MGLQRVHYWYQLYQYILPFFQSILLLCELTFNLLCKNQSHLIVRKTVSRGKIKYKCCLKTNRQEVVYSTFCFCKSRFSFYRRLQFYCNKIVQRNEEAVLFKGLTRK